MAGRSRRAQSIRGGLSSSRRSVPVRPEPARRRQVADLSVVWTSLPDRSRSFDQCGLSGMTISGITRMSASAGCDVRRPPCSRRAAVMSGSHAEYILAAFPTVHLSMIGGQRPTDITPWEAQPLASPPALRGTPTEVDAQTKQSHAGHPERTKGSGRPAPPLALPPLAGGRSLPAGNDLSRQRTSRERERLPRAEPLAAATVVRDWEGQYRGRIERVKPLGRLECPRHAKKLSAAGLERRIRSYNTITRPPPRPRPRSCLLPQPGDTGSRPPG